jgi:hypothetical protein
VIANKAVATQNIGGGTKYDACVLGNSNSSDLSATAPPTGLSSKTARASRTGSRVRP